MIVSHCSKAIDCFFLILALANFDSGNHVVGHGGHHSIDPAPRPVEWRKRNPPMSKNQRQTPRKPATKFAHLRKKMENQKVQVKKPKKK